MEKEKIMEQRAPRSRRRLRSEAPQPAKGTIAHQPDTVQSEISALSPAHRASDKVPNNPHPSAAAASGANDPEQQLDNAANAQNIRVAIAPAHNEGNEGIHSTEKSAKQLRLPRKPRSPRKQHQQSDVVHFDSYVQVASTDACDSTPAIFFRAGLKRFVFNASEGLQRVLGQYKMVSLPKVDAYLITRVSTSSLAGLPGILMGSQVSTPAAAALLGDTQAVTVYGPTSINAYVETFLPYVQNAVHCKVHELDVSQEGVAVPLAPIVSIPELTITPIVVRPTVPVIEPAPAAAPDAAVAAAKAAGPAAPDTSPSPSTASAFGAPVAPATFTAATATVPASVAATAPDATPTSTAATALATTAPAAAVPNSAATAATTDIPVTESSVAGKIAGRTVTGAGHEVTAMQVEPPAAMQAQRTASKEGAGATGEQASGGVAGAPGGGNAQQEGVFQQRPQKRRRTDMLQAPLRSRSASHECSVCYVVKLLDRPGKFNPKKAAALGVPRGPLYGELQKGKAVLGANGRVVQPAEVLEGSTPGPLLVVLDCPSTDYLPSYQHAALLQPHLGKVGEQGSSLQPVVVVAHVGPLGVVRHPDYAQWLHQWGRHCHHILPTHPAAPNQPTYLHRFETLQVKLNRLDPHVFPLPASISAPVATDTTPAAVKSEAVTHNCSGGDLALEGRGAIAACNDGGSKSNNGAAASIHHAMVGCRFTLYPPHQAGLDASSVPKLADVSEVQQEFWAAYTATQAECNGAKGPLAEAAGTEAVQYGATEGMGLPSKPDPDCSTQTTATADPVTDTEPMNGVGNGTTPPEEQDEAQVHTPAEGAPHRGRGASSEVAGVQTDDDLVPECIRNVGREDLEVVFLGTASAMPGTYRNVSGTLVNMFERGCMMVDCGEDSWSQVRRRYGEAAAEALMRRLQLVWISHMHADHHGGLYPLLQVRRRLLGRTAAPLLVIGPHSLARVLYNYHGLMPMRYAFLPSQFAEKDDLTGVQLPHQTLEAVQRVKEALQLEQLSTIPVQHGCAAHGLLLHSQRGWRLVFSGDTQPCRAVKEAAQGATLLVHEATFEDALVHEARLRRHCTISEALQVAREAGAYRVALTHFSQRYPKLPSTLNSGALERAFFAFDHATINLVDLPRLPKLVASWDHLCRCLTSDDQEDPAGAMD